MKTVLSVLALVLLPGLAAAQCLGDHTGQQQAMSCADGSVYDTEAGACVPVSTS
jgi:hypothetical protein